MTTTAEHLPPLDADQWNDLLYTAVVKLLKWPPDPAERAYCTWLADQWRRQHLTIK